MTQDDDFDGQFAVVTPTELEQLEDANEAHIQEGQRHAPGFVASLTPPRVQVDSSGCHVRRPQVEPESGLATIGLVLRTVLIVVALCRSSSGFF